MVRFHNRIATQPLARPKNKFCLTYLLNQPVFSFVFRAVARGTGLPSASLFKFHSYVLVYKIQSSSFALVTLLQAGTMPGFSFPKKHLYKY